MRSVRVLVAVAVIVLGASGGAAEDSPTAVHLSSAGITITPLPTPNFQSMTVQIVDPQDAYVVNAVSKGEAVSWAPLGATDGYYRYEAVVHAWDPAEVAAGQNNPPSERSYRTFGSFWVRGQVITQPPSTR